MATAKSPRKADGKSELIRSITTPLGFYALALLIIEATLTVVLTWSKLEPQYVWGGFLWMVGIFIGVILIVTVLAAWCPKNLLFGKEEHREPLLEPSAFKDQIEDVIAANVKPECLNPPSV